MGLLDNITMAFSSLMSNKMRSLLTMLGIIIGISSVIAIMTVGGSLSGSISESLTSFGITNITVSVTQKDTDSGEDNGARMFQRDTMAEADLISTEMIEDFRQTYSDSIKNIVLSQMVGTSQVLINNNNTTVTITGVNQDYQDSNSINLLTGRWINQDDLDTDRKACVVSNQFIEDTFGNNTDGVGESFNVTINGFTQEFYIVGIYEYENSSTILDLSGTTTSMYIPVTTAKELTHARKGYASIVVESTTDVDTDAFLQTTKNFFASYYTHNDTYTVEASNLASMLDVMNQVMSQVTMAIAAIAAISLLVGGIGVMNIMLVSITERTREIGTRKALGATKNDIRFQFITEAIIICLIGGIIGIILGIALGYAAAGLLDFSVSPSLSAILISVIFSMAIGIFFGYYPANKAAKLDPIDALRYE